MEFFDSPVSAHCFEMKFDKGLGERGVFAGRAIFLFFLFNFYFHFNGFLEWKSSRKKNRAKRNKPKTWTESSQFNKGLIKLHKKIINLIRW